MKKINFKNWFHSLEIMFNYILHLQKKLLYKMSKQIENLKDNS